MASSKTKKYTNPFYKFYDSLCRVDRESKYDKKPISMLAQTNFVKYGQMCDDNTIVAMISQFRVNKGRWPHSRITHKSFSNRFDRLHSIAVTGYGVLNNE